MFNRFSRRRFLAGAAILGLSRVIPARAAAPPLFEEVPASASGISFVHDNAMSSMHWLPETMGGGVAFIDYDNDGWLDIFFTNSGECDFFHPKTPLKNALYKNNRNGTFTDVTAKSGLEGGWFANGVAVGDFDNDGWPDMFVCGYGRSALYKNNRDGTFTDITEQAKLKVPDWTTSAVWFDYDNDGKLDLFVCVFVQDGGKTTCGDNKIGKSYYCIPRIFKPRHSVLYRNNGDGTFTDVTAGTDIEKALGKAMSAVATDINNDGQMDLFVTNDTVQNFLFINRGRGTWEEVGLASGVGFSDDGRARSGMGIDSFDLYGRGWQDLFVANVDQEMFSLYKNNGDETFTDIGPQTGISAATRLLSGWGLKVFDYDNDGELDLILGNGHPDDMIDKYSTQVHYREPLLLFHQDNRKLRNISAEAGPIFQKPMSTRGLAIGDYDNDGCVDVVVANNGEPPVLLKNNAAKGNNWVGLRLQGTTVNRDAIGARLTWSVGGVKKTRLKTGGGSFQSACDLREVIGLGKAEKLDLLEIKWPLPSGKVERFTDVPVGKYVTITEGKGIA